MQKDWVGVNSYTFCVLSLGTIPTTFAELIGPFKARWLMFTAQYFCTPMKPYYTIKEFKVRCVFKNPFWKVGLQGFKECEFCRFRSFHAVSYFQEKCYICLMCDSASHNNCNFFNLNKKKC